VCKRFESLLRRACKNYKKLHDLGLVENRALHRERAKTPEALDALEEYDKIVEGFRKFVDSKVFKEFLGWSRYEENLVKWAGKERISVGYLGRRERGAEYFLMDIPLEYELPFERTIADLYELYGLVYLENLRIPSQEESELLLLEFLEWVKKWPREQLEWVIRNRYPLTDTTGGFWSVVTKVLALVNLREVWEEIVDDWKSTAEGNLKKTPEFEVLKAVFLGDVWEAEKYVRGIVEEVANEVLDKYGMTTANVDKVKEEFLERTATVFKERVAPETRIREVYEQIKPVIPPEKVELTRAGLWKAIRWLFLHPTMDLDAFASSYIFPLGFTTEQARAIALKIAEKVTKIVIRPPPPKPVVPEVKKETVEALVDREIRSYSLVHPEAEEYLKRRRDEVVAEALRRVPERVKRDFEEKTAKGIAYVEEDAFRSASHEVLLVVSEFGEKAKVTPPLPPPPPVEKRPLRELPEQVRQLSEELESEAYASFLAVGLPREEWLKHRGSVLEEIRSAIDVYGELPKLEAEEKVRARVVKFVSDLIGKITVPAPPPAVAPPAVVPAAFPPTVEVVYAPRKKPLSEEELKALQREILGMPYEKAVDEYLKAITEGRTADVEAWRRKFEEASKLVEFKRRVVKE
jgi:hypothetical protein